MASNHTDGAILDTDRYCRGCKRDGVSVILDTTMYSDCCVAVCGQCGHEFEMDLSDYEPEPTALELRCRAKDRAEMLGYEPSSHA